MSISNHLISYSVQSLCCLDNQLVVQGIPIFTFRLHLPHLDNDNVIISCNLPPEAGLKTSALFQYLIF